VVKDLAFDASGRWLAYVGADSDVDLWDLKMVHDELAALGLAWDQAPPVGDLPGHPTPASERVRPLMVQPAITDRSP
jgi:hypothetical protein